LVGARRPAPTAYGRARAGGRSREEHRARLQIHCRFAAALDL